ncbi:MAG: exodeoxyribonuclease VII small subunit [Steroidobacteraceae bacterium]
MKRKSTPVEFEKSLAELETLVEKLERGDIPLEDALKTFERGIALTRECQSAIKSAQQRVEILVNRNGEQQLAPFESSDGADSIDPDIDPDEDE